MIFTIFVYIVGVLFTLNGFHFSYKGGMLFSRMSQQEMLKAVTNRISGVIQMCTGILIIIIMAKG